MLTPRPIGHGDVSRLYGRDTGVGHRDSTFGSATDTIGSAGFTAAQGSFPARVLIADTVLRRVATLMVEAMDMTDT
jgi:hypothetical protein